MERTWSRVPERRTGLSRLLAQGIELVRCPMSMTARRARLEQDIAALFKARAVRIGHGTPVPQRLGVREGPSTIVVPVPGPSNPPMNLEVQGRVGDGLDNWARHTMIDVARIVSFVLGAAPAVTSPDEKDAPVGSSQFRLIGTSREMTALRHQIARLARTDFTVLIEGESGSGKELVARLIHEHSERRHGPFIGVNCAALVETLLEAELFGIEDRTATGVKGRRGKFELADGGTLFLDEVADLAPIAQAKLLRAIQEMSVERVGGHTTRPVNTRLVVATNKSLRELVASGHFRDDLFYRLSGVEIHVPPLRTRRDDIPALIAHFLERHRTSHDARVSGAATDALMSYAWPGNVRELERVIERAVALSNASSIELDDLPGKVTGDYVRVLEPSLRQDDTMRAWGSRYARLVLERCGHNKRRACGVLGISYHTLQAYLRYGEDRQRRADGPQHRNGSQSRGCRAEYG